MREGGRETSHGQAHGDPNGRGTPRSVAQLGRDVGDLRDRLMQEADARPFRTAGLAVATGYLLGGGLFSKLTARLLGTGLRIGLRVAFIPFVTQSLAAWGEDLVRSRPSGPQVTRRGHDDDAPASASGVGPFAADTSPSSGSSTSTSTSIPRKSPRSTDPKENNP
jgi:hypothetical protein